MSKCIVASVQSRAGASALALFACLIGATAGAETTPAAAQDSAGLQEIVVTATKKSQSVIDIPASITAVTADALGAGKIQNIADLAEDVPNLSVGNQFGVNRTFIRGIGLTSIDLGADGAVSFLQNGAQLACRRSNSRDFMISTASRSCAARREPCTDAGPPPA